MEIKMKPEEAYNLIELCLDYDKDMSEYPERYEMALQIAREVFYKQTPVKPLRKGKILYCPNCDHWLLWDDAIPNEWDNYCGICGQAIDWEVDA